MTDSNAKKTTTSKAKKTATKTAPAPLKSALAARSLPAMDDLKARFKAGSIPLQSDFGDLIDMANTGAQAAGQAAGQSGPGKGMRLSSTGQLEPAISSYNFTNDVQGCSPVKVDTDTNQIVVDIADGLAEVATGLGVKAGNGITVDSDGVSIDPLKVLPKGIITMFSGTKSPEGWALCNGDNDTPDLRDRFILGGEFVDIGGKSADKFTGHKDQKRMNIETDKISPKIYVSTDGHALTIDQMPSHDHEFKVPSGRSLGMGREAASGSYAIPLAFDYTEDTPYIAKAGGGKEHSHNAQATQSEHGHTANVSVPYYILAFIMKL